MGNKLRDRIRELLEETKGENPFSAGGGFRKKVPEREAREWLDSLKWDKVFQVD